MSLMNDMLKDLDRRGARGDHDPLGDHHRATRSVSIMPAVMAGGVVILIVVIATLWWWPESREPSPSAAASSASSSAPTQVATTPVKRATAEASVEKPEVQAVEPLLHEPSRSEPTMAEDGATSEEAATPEASAAKAELIANLLESARTARARDRLTRPVSDNAYEYYQQVLAMEPDQPEALAGLAAIAQRYRELAEAAMDREALTKARQFLQRARSVRPGVEGIQASEARLASLAEASAKALANVPAEPKSAAEPATAQSSLSVRPDPASVDRNRASQAERWWSQGDVKRARSLLEKTLREWSFEGTVPVQSIGVLFDVYLSAEELTRAQQLLADHPLPAEETLYRRAQLALATGQTEKALSLLESGAEEAARHEPYRALMARLYYEQKRFTEAANHYQALLTDMGERPAYWLGLGLAKDAQDDDPAALNAFSQALESGGYRNDAAVQEYLHNRVNALRRRIQTQES
ncbi:hypothetical protein [Marinimicrobium locisalis]|uniref:hypothetical protein n=1 Tax=Marinimicrobium locisalis TaxID=546022 RepID=UPI003221F446